MRPAVAGPIGAVVALVVALAGCTASAPPIVVTHVHAVDLDDERSAIYVATHEGILRVTAGSTGPEAAGGALAGYGSVERLGEWMGDVMAMTRLDDTIYLSGHPAPGADTAPNIGVYQTDVHGREFVPVSLEGEVDFHSMTGAGVPGPTSALAGIDSMSGRVIVSRDGGQTWTVGAVIGARSLSWDARAERLYATTEQGLQVSIDDGATFAPVSAAPPLLLIASSPTGTSSDAFLAGLDIEGVVHTSTDGSTWISAGLAPPGTEALSVGRGGALVVAGIDGVQRSDDRGVTWTVIAEF